jgi:hypothetical protein
MNKSAALEKLTKLESEAAELRKIIEQPEEAGLWEPEWGGKYYLLDAYGCSAFSLYNNRGVDGERFDYGNCFQSEDIARKASQLQRVHNHVMRAAFQADPDAGEYTKGRQHAIYLSGKVWVSELYHYRTDKVCVNTYSQATEACRLLNAWQAKEDAKT